MPTQYDIVIIGSGPGGYSAAVTAARLGAKVCIIEKNELGGACVNKGCIPTKTIMATALLNNKLKSREQYGINADNISINYQDVLKRAADVVGSIKKTILQVINANKIDLVKGFAEVVTNDTVMVNGAEIKSKRIIVATGSKPKPIKKLEFDGKRIFSSEQFLELKELPKSILIAGAGVIGCEWAGILANLSVSVTLVEMQDKILPEEDSDLSRMVETNLKKMGVSIKLNTTVDEIEQEKAIICIGRDPSVEGIQIIETKKNGWIKVNKYLRTDLFGVYAIGDVKGPPLLAYTAEREGKIAAYNALGKEMVMDYSIIPRVVFSIPELASVGLREKEAEDAGVARSYYKGLGRALADGETNGFAKIIYDKSTNKILGVGIVGKNAGELINEAALAIKCGITVKEWADIVRPHPVLSEIFGLALEKI